MNDRSASSRFRARSLAVLAGTAAISLQLFTVQSLAASGEPEVHKAEVASAATGKGSKGETLFQANCAACHRDAESGRISEGGIRIPSPQPATSAIPQERAP